MHYSLFKFLFLVSLVTSLVIIDARKLTSVNAIFSVDLIRRNINREQHPLGSISHNHNINLITSTLDDSNTVQTALISDQGDYDIKFSVGTPPIEFTAVADTGSDLIWIQCSPCQQCLTQPSPLFNPADSSTYLNLACDSQMCNANQTGLDTGCNTDDQSCSYFTAYGDGTQSTGVLSTETITLSTPGISFANIYFGCGYIQNGTVGPNGDGIVGLGGGPLSLTTQLGPSIDYKFSYCLTPADSGVNGKLSFGLDVSGPGLVSTPFTQKDDSPTYYYLTLDSISTGNTSVTVSQDIIIDSGTTLTYLPYDVYDGVRTAIKDGVSISPVDDPNKMFDPCYTIDGFNPPELVFHFSGADVVLKAENTFWKISTDLTCFAMMPSNDSYLFGNIAQVNFHVGYDLKANQVSFAPTDCSNF